MEQSIEMSSREPKLDVTMSTDKRRSDAFEVDKRSSDARADSDMGFLAIVIGIALFSCTYYFSKRSFYYPVPLSTTPWTFTCVATVSGSKCVKRLLVASDEGPPLGLDACRMTCTPSDLLWPAPTGQTNFSRDLVYFLPGDVRLVVDALTPLSAADMATSLKPMLIEILMAKHPRYDGLENRRPFPGFETGHVILLNMDIREEFKPLNLSTDESYHIDIGLYTSRRRSMGRIHRVNIKATTYFGARHALETFTQMVSFDEITGALLTFERAHVEDGPVYPYRGLMVDTASSFVGVSGLLRIVDAMAANKLNSLHWHFSDILGFSLLAPSVPDLARYGALDSRFKAYSAEDVRLVRDYAMRKGVRLVPELDVPASCGSAWRFKKGLATSRMDNIAGCNQLNIASAEVIDILAKLYIDVINTFDSDIFHMGGDEVDLKCWKDVPELKNATGDAALSDAWLRFLLETESLIDKAYNSTKTAYSRIMRSNSLTEQRKLSSDIMVQVMNTNAMTTGFLLSGHPIIYSDEWNFNCKYGAVCSPKSWKSYYGEKGPRAMLSELINNEVNSSSDQIDTAYVLGGEGLLWTWQLSEHAIDGKLWPNAAAMAERLWTDQKEKVTDWSSISRRLELQSRRMAGRGMAVEHLQPEWCSRNEGQCYV